MFVCLRSKDKVKKEGRKGRNPKREKEREKETNYLLNFMMDSLCFQNTVGSIVCSMSLASTVCSKLISLRISKKSYTPLHKRAKISICSGECFAAMENR